MNRAASFEAFSIKSFTKNLFTIYHPLQGQALIFGRNLLPEKNGRVI
ncbi:hypothetical protein SXCC_02808 [Gluconacetobacter sp. SXCC-1]|nr:hypothetical protein SXCC_02808 [Gluconacetobacter sp. SXCC-1]